MLESALKEYAEHAISLADAGERVRAAIADDPDRAASAYAHLDAAMERGEIDAAAYEYLAACIGEGRGDESGDGAGSADAGETTVLTGTAPAESRRPEHSDDEAPASDTPDLDLRGEGGDTQAEAAAAGGPPDFDFSESGEDPGDADSGAGADEGAQTTVVATGAPDSGDSDAVSETMVATKPAGGGDSDSDGDGDSAPSSDSASSSDDGSGASSKRTSQRSWTPPGAEGSPELQGLGPGSVIKDRFVLEKVLGSGGMGKVYQARDQLKVEARDRNPYVAMKVLTEDFKEHPEAFIALQRESSRQQRLAHPNIATVYDFDRIGTSGTQVFITMELMEGYPLNTYIKKKVKPRGGLPPEEAIPMIRQLGAALAYAHKRDIVHSDFKPGNCFLCNDGTVKVLDFGIARAVKHQSSSSEGGESEAGEEKTYFDPGQLGALTPAYASLEMLEGEAPDPRDDIYALACVSYELLTGHHPFGRKSAAQARAGKLTPAPIKTLKRRQMKGLLRGLAFLRDNRTADVETFVEQVEGRLNWHKNPYIIGGGLAAALAIASVSPVMNYLEQRRIDRMVESVQTGHPQVIEQTLNKLPELEPTTRQTITEEARDTIQGYFNERIKSAVDPSQGRYDFAQAEQVLGRAKELYPDSQAVADLEQYLASAREKRLNELNEQFMQALQAGRLLRAQGSGGQPAVPTVLERIEQVDADHELLTDARIPHTYASLAQGAINTGDLDKAQAYIETGEQLLPGEGDLDNTRDRLALARLERRRSQNVEALRRYFEGSFAEMDSLEAIRNTASVIVDLAQLAPRDPALRAIREAAAPIAGRRAEAFGRGTESQAQAFLARHREVLGALDIYAPLIAAQLAPQPADERAATRERLLAETVQRLDSALDAPDFGPVWQAEVDRHLGYLEALVDGDDGALLARARAEISRVFLERASALRQQRRFSMALATLDRARGLGLDTQRLADARDTIQTARQDFLRQRQDQAQQARLEGLKKSVTIQARALEVEQARATLEKIRPKLDPDAPFLEVTVPDVLGQAYQTVAARQADQGNYKKALETARSGLEVAPNNRNLQQARKDYKVEVNIARLNDILRQKTEFDTARLARLVNEVRAWAPARYKRLKPQFVELLAGRIEGIGEYDRRKAQRLATRASNVFPGSTRLARLREKMAPDPWPEGSAARAALSAGRLSEAQNIVDRALEEMPQHPEVNNFQKDLQARKDKARAAFEAFQQDLEAGNLDQAQDHLAQARSLWVDNGEYRQAQSELSARLARERRQQSRVLARGQDLESLKTSGGEIVSEDWKPIKSNRPCTRKLAGHGPRARAVCYDLLHQRVRGPLMVVIPPGQDQDYFAISKYEISNEDYNKYCFLSGNCAVDQDAQENLPKTGLGLEQIRHYINWLSQRTGKSYRFPTRQEWVYAAKANGEQPPRDFNCRVTLGDNVLKGSGLIDITAGHQNGWGLKNYVGNAQELVRSNGNLLARGGAFRDPHAQCSYQLERPYDAGSGAMTGFRVVREEVPKAK